MKKESEIPFCIYYVEDVQEDNEIGFSVTLIRSITGTYSNITKNQKNDFCPDIMFKIFCVPFFYNYSSVKP